MEFESAVYKTAQELSADKFNNLAPALVECFAGNDRLWMGESTELSTKTEVIEDIDLLHYLADIIVADAKVIRGALKDVLEKDDKNFAPLLSQELAIRSNISWVANRNFYDKILTTIANKRPDTEKHKPVYRAVHAMFGGAGVGKTKVIARTTKKILEKLGANVEYVYVAKTIEQAKNLQKSCGGDGSVYDADQFSTALFEEWPTTEPVDIGGIKGTGHVMYNGAAVFINRKSMKNLGKYDHDAQFTDSIYKKNDNKSIASVFKTSTAKIKVVVVDEATQFTTAQWDCMSMRACHPNEQFSIFALGDLRQQCGIVSYDHRIDNNGLIVNSSAKATSTLEEGLLLKSPRISVTMRADVMALYKASQGYNKAFDACEEWQKKNKEVGIFGKVNLDASVIRDYTKNITHSYWYNDDFSEFYGIHSCDSDKAIKILTGLLSKNKSGSICYIGDGTNSLNYPAGIQNLNPNNAQGSEFDYVVIDMKWLNGGTVDDKFEVPVNMLRSLYTLIQRARKGCIIVNNNENGDVAEYFNISQIFDPSGADGFKLSDTQHKSYKDWRMKSYEDLKYDAEAFRKMFKDFSITTGAKTGGGTAGKSGGSNGQQQAPGAPTGAKPGNAGVEQSGGKGTVGSRGFTSNKTLTEATKKAENQYAERKKGKQVAAESLRKTKTAEITSSSKEQHRHGGNQAIFREW